MKPTRFVFVDGCVLSLEGCGFTVPTLLNPATPPTSGRSYVSGNRRVEKTDADWKKLLTRSQYNITRNSGTEWPNSSELTHEQRAGNLSSASVATTRFSAPTPNLTPTRAGLASTRPFASNAVYNEPDGNRTEVRCSVCDAHLGHVFNDGPDPTGLRYCMNGVALTFGPKEIILRLQCQVKPRQYIFA